METETRREQLPELMTVKQYASWYQVHENTVRRWVDQGAVPVRRIGGTIRIVRSTDDGDE